MEVVDTETAKEFMKETLAAVEVEELTLICAEIEAKSAWFRETLAVDAIPKLEPEQFDQVLGRIFSIRGKGRKLLAELDIVVVRARLTELLDGAGDPGSRLQAFGDQFEGLADNLRVDLASELLHFARPEKHWLWTRWMWDPRTRTGSLPLVTTAAYDLQGESSAEIYMKVGNAVAFVHEVGAAAGFQKISNNIFGTDVYLACVYTVYVYTVLKMRMTQEFNKVIPQLPEFCRRLLGVHRKNGSRKPV
jgi:hypothetical protein